MESNPDNAGEVMLAASDNHGLEDEAIDCALDQEDKYKQFASTHAKDSNDHRAVVYPRDLRHSDYLPSGRPIAEPPMFDYDYFIEHRLPSDIRFSKLFPTDKERWIRCRDVRTENFLLEDYSSWIGDMKDHAEDEASMKFYRGLCDEVWTEWYDVARERDEVFSGTSDLAWWEYTWLDQDGETKQIREWTATRWEHSYLNREAWMKYKGLAPRGYKPREFWTYDVGLHCHQLVRPALPTKTLVDSAAEHQQDRWPGAASSDDRSVSSHSSVVLLAGELPDPPLQPQGIPTECAIISSVTIPTNSPDHIRTEEATEQIISLSTATWAEPANDFNLHPWFNAL